MRRVLVLLVGLLASTAWAEDVWTLKSGPVAVASIPLDPVQPVEAWRGTYSDGIDTFSVYVTRSPQFFAPRRTGVLALGGTDWTVVVLFPGGWTEDQKTGWMTLWAGAFKTLSSLPNPGWPVVLPSVLRKG